MFLIPVAIIYGENIGNFSFVWNSWCHVTFEDFKAACNFFITDEQLYDVYCGKEYLLEKYVNDAYRFISW